MKIAIIGYGNIGRIYARSIVKFNLAERNDVLVLTRSQKGREEALASGFHVLENDLTPLNGADLIVLAVKPQDFSALAEQLSGIFLTDQIVISMMAGITIAQLSENLNHKTVVRAMPNSPIGLGMGMTGFCAAQDVDVNALRKAEQLLSTTGRTLFLTDETKMDAVTALSGSGPAYFYYFVRSMINAGVEMGFDVSVSSLLVKQTMLGAFHLMNSSDDDLDGLIRTVASKGGTTEAALGCFEHSGFETIVKEGLKKAEIRGRELSKGLNL